MSDGQIEGWLDNKKLLIIKGQLAIMMKEPHTLKLALTPMMQVSMYYALMNTDVGIHTLK
jgi:hypothetical protein